LRYGIHQFGVAKPVSGVDILFYPTKYSTSDNCNVVRELSKFMDDTTIEIFALRHYEYLPRNFTKNSKLVFEHFSATVI
jgi:hypothetical protein